MKYRELPRKNDSQKSVPANPGDTCWPFAPAMASAMNAIMSTVLFIPSYTSHPLVLIRATCIYDEKQAKKYQKLTFFNIPILGTVPADSLNVDYQLLLPKKDSSSCQFCCDWLL